MTRTFWSISISIFLCIPLVFAKTTPPIDAGILPTSPLYFFDKAFERIHGIFLFSKESRISYHLHLANERLGESTTMFDQDRIELGEKTIKEYKKNIQNALQILEKITEKEDIQTQGKNIRHLVQSNTPLLSTILSILSTNTSVEDVLIFSETIEETIQELAPTSKTL